MNILCVITLLLAATGIDFRDAKIPSVKTVPRQLDALLAGGHIQGAAASERGIYLSHQLGIEHIGWDGRLIRHLNAPAHLGDICCADGKLYGAFGLRGKEYADRPGMVMVWDEETLAEIRCQRFKEPLDGITVLRGTVYVGVDGGAKPHPGCRVKRLDLELRELGETEIDLGYWIHYGVQTMATDGEHIFFGNYGVKESPENPRYRNCSMLTGDLRVIASTVHGCSEGFGMVPASVFRRERPVFFSVRALNGNMQGWRKDPVNQPPQVEILFQELRIN